MSDDTKKPNKDSDSKLDESNTSLVKPEQNDSTENQAKPADQTLTQEAIPNSEMPKIPKMEATQSKKSGSKENLFSAKPAPKLKAPKKRSKLRPLPYIAVILALMALAGIAWAAYNQYQMQQNFKQLKTDLKQQASAQTELNQSSSQTAQSSLQTAYGNQQIINQQSLLIQQLSQALTATQQKVRELSGRQKQDWLLAEAEYLIKLAQLKITLEKDKFTAIALLKTADQRILQTADNSLLELRQMIAQDITDLQLVTAPDLSGIASQLNAVSSQIPQLTLIALEFEPLNKLKNRTKPSSQGFNWKVAYENFLSDFVTIKDHSQPVKPLMSANQRGNLNSNIQLALQQAQIALLRGEQGLYQINLNNAIKWIGEFFQNNQAAQTILQTLTQVNGISINVQLPSELKAKQAIQAINQQRLYQWLENDLPKTPTTEVESGSEVSTDETTGDQL
jgi:uncharacterized protein HemX